MAGKAELWRAEEEGWRAFAAALDGIAEPACTQVGYTAEWSVKDVVGHVGCWHAEAVQVFEQIRSGTFRSEPVDVDAMNAGFVEALRDQPVAVVKAECFASRARFLREFDLLTEVGADAEEWFVECGSAHYADHTPRLAQWAKELRAGAGNGP